jgi:hypothetical protein
MPKLVALTGAMGQPLYVNPARVDAIEAAFEDDHTTIYFYWPDRRITVPCGVETVRALLDQALSTSTDE